ncbi:hypothetical protein IV203_003900 [Nitzschia inconspicua]|uniref:Peptidase M10 metallopeptidase domain-containing protein n=1 Tax=Nitzschia inconspicua TaxID=303405 RepID=A0A9K3L2Q9_9STRA|nr:hypothetical protein IV203_003900 [Nitzschia inconspicua]
MHLNTLQTNVLGEVVFETPSKANNSSSNNNSNTNSNSRRIQDKENNTDSSVISSLSSDSQQFVNHFLSIRTPPFEKDQPQRKSTEKEFQTKEEETQKVKETAEDETKKNGEEVGRELFVENTVEMIEKTSKKEKDSQKDPNLVTGQQQQVRTDEELDDNKVNKFDQEELKVADSDDDSDSKLSQEPPGILPTPKNDTKEEVESKEELDHVRKAEIMRQQLDALLDDIEATAEELKHKNPWINTTPQTGKQQKRHSTGTTSQNVSPAGSDFQIMVSAATSAPTPTMAGEDKSDNEFRPSESPARFRDDDSVPSVDSCKETPVRSNLTYAQMNPYVQLDSTGTAALVTSTPVRGMNPQASDVLMRKSNSSASIASSSDSERNASAVAIESNTPRTRKILEWLDPKSRGNKNVSDTWPTPSMATNIRGTNTPERQLPSRSLSTNEASRPQGKKVSEWWVPRPVQTSSNCSSPVSLPSMLGGSPTNEISDLESPRMSYPILNYKFSEEESDIHSQSLQDQASEINSNGEVSPSLQSMLHNTYNIAGRGKQQSSTPHSCLVSAGCPTDEGSSPVSKTLEVDVENNGEIQPNTTEKTDPSPTNESIDKSLNETPRSAWWLRRFAVFFISVAIAAVIAVPLCFRFLPVNQNTLNQQESSDDFLAVITQAPSAVTETSTSAPTFSPSESPTFQTAPVSPEHGLSTTAAPTQSASEEEYSWDNFRWNRIEMGENLWRNNLSEGSPSWYFADQSSGIDLGIINAADGAYHAYIGNAVNDYSKSDAVDALRLSTVPYQSLCEPVPGRIKICSGLFGNTDWYGQTIILLSDFEIVSAAIQINASKNMSPEILQHTICHQLGHALGLPHRTAGSCLQDIGGAVLDGTAISNQLQHPSQQDLDLLLEMYGSAV